MVQTIKPQSDIPRGSVNLIVAGMQTKGRPLAAMRTPILTFEIAGLLEPSPAGLSDARKSYARKADRTAAQAHAWSQGNALHAAGR